MSYTTEDYLTKGLLSEIPEMRSRWLSLTEGIGECASPALLLEELADYLTPLLADPSRHAELLERAFRAVDVIAMDSDEGATAVAYGFLDTLPPEVLPAALGWLGPCTAAILESLEDGTFDAGSGLAVE